MHNRCTGEFSARCGVCVRAVVEHVCAETGVSLTDEERRQLIGGLLARQHLILSGPQGSRQCELAHALAFSLVAGRRERVCTLVGHPWWAGNTGDMAYYANMQMAFSVWRLVYFLAAVQDDEERMPRVRSVDSVGGYAVCIERMSPAEIDLYFGTLPYKLDKLAAAGPGMRRYLPVRFIGTYDSDMPPTLDVRTLRVAALVHMDAASDR